MKNCITRASSSIVLASLLSYGIGSVYAEDKVISDLDETEQEIDQAIADGEAVANRIKEAKRAISDSRKNISHQEQLLQMKNTFNNLFETLIEQDVISKEQARLMMIEAEEKAAREINKEGSDVVPERVIRVPYVPESVIEDIRGQVREELRSKVTEDIMAQAKSERWGMPNALPEWISKIEWNGDIRVRLQADNFEEDNASLVYRDMNASNEARSDVFMNTTEDRSRMRLRARIGMTAMPTQNVKVGMRFATGNLTSPVSTNQTLGDYNTKSRVIWDRAYLKYTELDEDAMPWFSLTAGRMKNPWFGTDLIWDSDVTFDGLAVTYRKNLFGDDSLMDLSDESRALYFTIGAFPLEEVELSSNDKWLFGTQLTTEFTTTSQTEIKIGLAYYDYYNITGKKNTPGSRLLDFTAPAYMQKGNSVFNISNSTDPNEVLWALSSDYNLINLAASIDFAQLAPLHVVLDMDYVKNIGYDRDEIIARDNGFVGRSGGHRVASDPYEAKNVGYMLKASIGWPIISMRGSWKLSMAYKHLERDAVLDAFTDSDFHLGGTDNEGWILGGDYAITDDTWVSLRYMSADSIDAAPLNVETVQLDLNSRF